MRIYTFVLFASTAAPTCVIGTSRGSDLPSTKIDITASNSPFVDDLSKDVPANRLLRVQSPSPILTTSAPFQAIAKAAFTKLYSGLSALKLTPATWSQVMSEDERFLKELLTLSEKGTKEVHVDFLLPMVSTWKKHHQSDMLEKLSEWMEGRQPTDLVKVLQEHGFFGQFRYTDVLALKQYLGPSNEAMLFDTLLAGFGEGRLASMLSIAKLSPLNGPDAKLLRDELLAWWATIGKPYEDVVRLLGVSTLEKQLDLAYEKLEALVKYTALKYKLDSHNAHVQTIIDLRKTFGDAPVVRAMMDMLEGVESVGQHLHGKYGDESTKLKSEEHNNFAEWFKAFLFELWKSEDKTLSSLDMNPFGLTKQHDDKLRADYGAFRKENPAS